MNHKAFYVVLTSGMRWGKGLDIKTALNNAGVKSLPSKTVEVEILIGIVKGTATDEIVEALSKCFGVNGMGYLNLCHDITDQDESLVKEYFVGWLNDSSFTKAVKV